MFSQLLPSDVETYMRTFLLPCEQSISDRREIMLWELEHCQESLQLRNGRRFNRIEFNIWKNYWKNGIRRVKFNGKNPTEILINGR